MKIVAVVGMTGSGKSEVSRIFAEEGFFYIRFGDITENEITKRGLEVNEENERHIREQLRRELGMAAYAKLNLPEIDAAMKKSNVVIDGLYSWEEYLFLKENYGEYFNVVAVWSSPKTRYTRLMTRQVRGLTTDEASNRDKAEIENLNKGGPIAMADFTIINESFMDDLETEVLRVIGWIKE
jgi:dephospho-CoA kinase